MMTDSEILTKSQAWDIESKNNFDDWKENALENLRFYEGGKKQWDAADLHKLIEEKRPYITVNKIRGRIRMVCGYLEQNRLDCTTVPCSGDSSQQMCEIFNYLFKYIDIQNFSEVITAAILMDGVLTGRGWLGMRMNYDENILGDLTEEYVDPRTISFDPFAKMFDMRDSKYLRREYWLTKNDIEMMYSDKKIDLESITTESFPGDVNRIISPADPRYRLKEYWYREYSTTNLVVDIKSGDVVDEFTNDIANDRDKVAAVMNDPDKRVLRKKKSMINCAMIVANNVLWHNRSPYSDKYYPYLPYMPMAFNGEDGLTTSAMVDDMKDLQKERNKRRAQIMSIVNTSAHSGWIMDEGAVTDEEHLKQFGSTPGVLIKKRQGRFLEQIKPNPVPEAVIALDDKADRDFDEVSLLNPSLLGQPIERESGKAIVMRKASGVMALSDVERGNRYFQLLRGRLRLEIIQRFYKKERVFYIADGPTGRDAKKIMVNKMVPGSPITKINDISIGKYDVTVNVSQSSPTYRMTRAAQLLEMQQYGISVPPALLVREMDFPDKDEVIKMFEAQAQTQTGPPGGSPPPRPPLRPNGG
jgi:hypothetical protein